MPATKSGWIFGVGAAAAIVILALLPQIQFCVNRGASWHGGNASMHPDEVVYSAYVAELIRGRARRNDPYTGRQNWPDESSYTVQMAPAYLVALPARVLGLSASTTYIVLPPLFAFISALSLYWFISSTTRDKYLGAAGVWIILGLGTLAAGQGLGRHFVTLPYLIPQWLANLFLSPSLYHLPFLRFYQPAVAFPCFFLFNTLVWLALNSQDVGKTFRLSLAAGLTFAVLVFSYFFLWTAAAAWLALISVLWFSLAGQRRAGLIVFGVVTALALLALVPYSLLMSHRPAALNNVEALVLSHRPDLFRVPEIIGYAVMATLVITARRTKTLWRDPVFLLATSFAMLPLIVFNQQVISGRSLQPLHYEWFIANYASLGSAVLTGSLWRRSKLSEERVRSNRRLAVFAACALLFGAGEVWLTIGLHLDYNRKIDEAKPVMNRLASMGAGESNASSVVLLSDLALADRLPTDAPQSVLWAPRMLVFSGITFEENRERFFQQLYYTGFDERRFRDELDRGDWNFYAGLFGYARLSPVMRAGNDPVTPAELETRLQDYLTFVRAFNRERAESSALSYFFSADPDMNYTNLDRWYQRDAGEKVGDFTLYRLSLRR